MGLFIDDGQQFEHVIEAEGEKLAVTYRKMGTSDTEFLMMYLDNTSQHHNPAIAYEHAVPRVAKCIVAMTVTRDGQSESLDPGSALPRLGWAEFRELRNAVMGITKSQQKKQQEQEKN